MSKRIVFVLEHLTNRKLYRWSPVVSCVKRGPIVKHKRDLLAAGFIGAELRVVEYQPARTKGVDK